MRFTTLIPAAIMLALAVPGTAAAQSGEGKMPPPTIRVSGEGEAQVQPDMAIVTLGVLREAPTAREAVSANNAAMAQVIEALKQAGIEERDMQTSNFSIQPRYTYPQNRNGEEQAPRIVGYTATNTLSVRIRDLNLAGAVLDQAVSLGMNTEGGINFTNDDPSAAIAQARAAAMRDAMERARILAEAAGVRLGPLLEITELGQQPPPIPYARDMRKMEMATASSVPLQAGENVYRVTVQAAWQIMQ